MMTSQMLKSIIEKFSIEFIPEDTARINKNYVLLFSFGNGYGYYVNLNQTLSSIND